jgi:hypothetical protein
MKSQLSTLSEDQLKSYILRLLIHYIGDIHQLLHATARVNPDYPKWYAGGNFVKLPIIEGAKNFHSVWDSMIYSYTGTPDMPFCNALWHQIGADADNMENSYEFTPSEFQNMKFDQWAQETLRLQSQLFTLVSLLTYLLSTCKLIRSKTLSKGR